MSSLGKNLAPSSSPGGAIVLSGSGSGVDLERALLDLSVTGGTLQVTGSFRVESEIAVTMGRSASIHGPGYVTIGDGGSLLLRPELYALSQTSDASSGDYSLSLDDASHAATGDTLVVVNSLGTNSDWDFYQRVDVSVVRRVSGSEVEIFDPLEFDHPSSSNVAIYLYKRSSISIRGLRISTDRSDSVATGVVLAGWNMPTVHGAVVYDSKITDGGLPLEFRNCVSPKVLRMDARNCQQGVQFTNCRGGLIRDVTYDQVYQPFVVAGCSGTVFVSNLNGGFATGGAMDSHASRSVDCRRVTQASGGPSNLRAARAVAEDVTILVGDSPISNTLPVQSVGFSDMSVYDESDGRLVRYFSPGAELGFSRGRSARLEDVVLARASFGTFQSPESVTVVGTGGEHECRLGHLLLRQPCADVSGVVLDPSLTDIDHAIQLGSGAQRVAFRDTETLSGYAHVVNGDPSGANGNPRRFDGCTFRCSTSFSTGMSDRDYPYTFVGCDFSGCELDVEGSDAWMLRVGTGACTYTNCVGAPA